MPPLPPEILVVIQRILDADEGKETSTQDSDSEDDVFRPSPIFNRSDALNRLFPDEQSLSRLSTVKDELREQERSIRSELTVLRQALREHQDPEKMQSIQEMIADLFSQMNRIREKAVESEAIVRNLTKDIQTLDQAKRSLALSMTMLKRFQMLVNALGQLEDQVRNRSYYSISETLGAVKQLASSFRDYMSISHVSAVWRRIQEQQGFIRVALDEDFDKFFLQEPSRPIKDSVISDACLVVDVLGEDVRLHYLEKYCSLELREYRRIFNPSEEAGQLDNLPRRFAWFRRVLSAHDSQRGTIFPKDWRSGEMLTARFIEATRSDMVTLLAKDAKGMGITNLLETLQRTKDFETFVIRKYDQPLKDILFVGSNALIAVQSISSAFEPHLGVFIDAQDKAIADILAPYRGTKARSSMESGHAPSASVASTTTNGVEASGPSSPALPSSTALFYFYGQSLEQCARLSTGSLLFDLATLHRKWLRIYAEDVLLTALKRPERESRKSVDMRFSPSETRNICTILNTADYCQTTASELEEKLADKIDESFKEKISFQPERELFTSVIAAALLSVLRELESACEPSLAIMSRAKPWANQENVSAPSAYVSDLDNAITSVANLVRQGTESKKYVKSFCDKAALLIIALFTAALVKSRPLKEIGAEQLLLDTQGLRASVLKLPGEAAFTSSFVRSVTKMTSNLEILLKVVAAPIDPVESFILNYTLLIGDASFSNFQKVLDLKGTPRVEQNALLDSFLTVTSTKDELASTSFLSALDMDPGSGAHPLVNGIASPGGTPRPSLTPGGLSEGAANNIFAALTSPLPAISGLGGSSPAASGTATPVSDIAPSGRPEPAQKREVFSDLRRFVSLAVRRDTNSQPSS